jgi:hypothetical protein
VEFLRLLEESLSRIDQMSSSGEFRCGGHFLLSRDTEVLFQSFVSVSMVTQLQSCKVFRADGARVQQAFIYSYIFIRFILILI